MTKELPSPAMLRKLFSYEPETGFLFWNERPVEDFGEVRHWKAWNKAYAGKRALASCTDGRYLRGTIAGRAHYAHRVIWAIVTGEWPRGEIDHVDTDKKNNAWENLRDVTRQENMWNRPALARSASGIKGVSKCRRSNRWIAQFSVGGRNKTIGRFKCPTAAYLAYVKASAKERGEFGRVS